MDDPIFKNIDGKIIGLLGGSFNPAHEGHLQISLDAIKHLKVDHVWWLVSPGNPLKENSKLSSIDARLKMARVVIGKNLITATGIEEKSKTVYTIDTLLYLKERCPKTKLIWLMGEDNMIEFPKWKKWKKIILTLPIAIFKREGYSAIANNGKMALEFKEQNISSQNIGSLKDCEPPAWCFVPNQTHPASSTRMREEAQKKIKKEPSLNITKNKLNASNHKRQKSSKELLALAINNLEDNKAIDITTLDLKGKTSIADYMVVATGTSKRQVAALADYLSRELKNKGFGAPGIEGLEQADWVLLDAGDIIIHLFRPEVRIFYNIEKMWSLDLDAEVKTH